MAVAIAAGELASRHIRISLEHHEGATLACDDRWAKGGDVERRVVGEGGRRVGKLLAVGRELDGMDGRHGLQ